MNYGDRMFWMIDWNELDKGCWTPRETVNTLMMTVEEYANYGFYYLAEMLKKNRIR